MSRADLLHHRFNYRFGDSNSLYFGWEPFGIASREQIEPELLPWLECASLSRRYIGSGR